MGTMIQMVLTDMDETLLVDYHVPQVNRDAIAKARAQGVRVVAATGRSYDMVQALLKEMGTAHCADEYSICFNGAAIYRNDSAVPLHYHPLRYEQICAVHEVAKRYGLCFMAFSLDQIYMYHPTASEIARKTKQQAQFTIESDETLLRDKTVVKVVMQSDVEAQLYEIGKREADVFAAQNLEVSFSSGRFLECTCKGVSKGSALHWLCGHLGMTAAEVMAIGDNFNDLEMLREAGLGVCVADGREEVRAMADVVTKRGYRDGAVAEALERYVLHESKNV